MIIGTAGENAWCVVGSTPRPLLGIDQNGQLRLADGHVPAVEATSVFVDYEDEPGDPWVRFPYPAAFGPTTRPALRTDPVTTIAGAVAGAAPEGWRQVRVECAALGTRLTVQAFAQLGGSATPWIVPQDVVEALRAHRVATYTPQDGAWTGLRCTVTPSGVTELDTSADAPQWPRTREGVREYHDELRYLPRRDAPEWLFDRAWKHHEDMRGAERPTRPVRMCQVFDGRDAQGRPTASRPALAWSEARMVLDYLAGGELVLSARSTSEDEIDPGRPPEVPKAYLTDGVWVWPFAMSYYLHHHGIAPPRDFLDHVRRRGHTPPEQVPARAIDEAKAVVLGTDADALGDTAVAESLATVKNAIGELRVSKRFYSFDGPLEGGWSMLRRPDGWWTVFCVRDGETRNESRFPEVMEAGAHLVGCLALTRDQFRRPDDEELADYECPIRPWSVDPPLDRYDRRLSVDLVAGTEVDRYGTPDGNTVFVAGTALPQRGVAEPSQGKYRRYRAVNSFRVVSGVVRQGEGAVGGGTAFFLPQSVGELVQGGWFVEV